VHGILKIRARVMHRPDLGWRTRYGGRGTEEFTEAELDIDAARAAIGVSAGGKGSSA
jgi:NADH-quinone oxidoreductase subunit B